MILKTCSLYISLVTIFFCGSALAQNEPVYPGPAPTWDIAADILKDAQAGDPEAAYLMVYTLGDDYSEINVWLKKAAALGQIDAQVSLGWLLRENAEDSDASAQWFLKAAEQGHPVAQVQTALNVAIKTKDLKESVKWLEKAAAQNDYNAQLFLGLALASGANRDNIPAQNINYFIEEAKLWGSVENALPSLDKIYLAAQPEELSEAEKWLRLSSKNGSPYATCALGVLLSLKPNATSQEIEEGQQILSDAKDTFVPTQYYWGLFHLKGLAGFNKDEPEGKKWLEKAAEAGSSKAKSLL